jgi:hypothetical protein
MTNSILKQTNGGKGQNREPEVEGGVDGDGRGRHWHGGGATIVEEDLGGGAAVVEEDLGGGA